jgi:hypothetical protein
METRCSACSGRMTAKKVKRYTVIALIFDRVFTFPLRASHAPPFGDLSIVISGKAPNYEKVNNCTFVMGASVLCKLPSSIGKAIDWQ